MKKKMLRVTWKFSRKKDVEKYLFKRKSFSKIHLKKKVSRELESMFLEKFRFSKKKIFTTSLNLFLVRKFHDKMVESFGHEISRKMSFFKK